MFVRRCSRVDDWLMSRWIFTAVEHWIRRVAPVGWHVCKRRAPDRLAAAHADRVSMGLDRELYGLDVAQAGAARSAGLADGSRLPVSARTHFTNQIKFWGIQPSIRLRRRAARPTASHEQEVNRTLKRTGSCHGRIYRNIAELRRNAEKRLRRTLQSTPVDFRFETPQKSWLL